MKTKRIILSIAVLTALSLAGFWGVSKIRAQEEGGYHPLVQRLAERFGLNAAEVEETFNQMREERREGRQLQWEERLDQAVSDGQISQEQKEALLAKKAEMLAKRGEDRETCHQEMTEWLEQNGLDPDLLPMLWGGGHHGGFGGRSRFQ